MQVIERIPEHYEKEELVLELLDEEYEVHHHPWRYWHPPKDTGIPF